MRALVVVVVVAVCASVLEAIPLGVSWANLKFRAGGWTQGEVAGRQAIVMDLDDPAAREKAESWMEQGSQVVCVFSAGKVELSRSDVQNDKARWLSVVSGRPSTLEEGAWFDIVDSGKLSELKALQTIRMKSAKSLGCTAVLPLDIDCYAYRSCYRPMGGSSKVNSAQGEYNTWMSDTAHENDLMIGYFDAPGRASSEGSKFDFALTLDCMKRKICSNYNNFVDRGKTVFNIEHSGVAMKICDLSTKFGFNTLYCSGTFNNGVGTCPSGSIFDSCLVNQTPGPVSSPTTKAPTTLAPSPTVPPVQAPVDSPTTVPPTPKPSAPVGPSRPTTLLIARGPDKVFGVHADAFSVTIDLTIDGEKTLFGGQGTLSWTYDANTNEVSFQLVYGSRNGWLAIGINPQGQGMVGGRAVIGVFEGKNPGRANVAEYSLDGKSLNAITTLPESSNQLKNGWFGRFNSDFIKLEFTAGSIGGVPVVSDEPVTSGPTLAPTTKPSAEPTQVPSQSPSVGPSRAPSQMPSVAPSQSPSHTPSAAPTRMPSQTPTPGPTQVPSIGPTKAPVRGDAVLTTLPMIVAWGKSAKFSYHSGGRQAFELELTRSGEVLLIQNLCKLRWQVEGDANLITNFEFECPSNEGWVAVGTNPSGKMVGGKAFIGMDSSQNSGRKNVDQYLLDGKSAGSIIAYASQTTLDEELLKNSAFTIAGGKITLSFQAAAIAGDPIFPTSQPSRSPSMSPSGVPTQAPTGAPSLAPNKAPTEAPSTQTPTSPTATPGPTSSKRPSQAPTSSPFVAPELHMAAAFGNNQAFTKHHKKETFMVKFDSLDGFQNVLGQGELRWRLISGGRVEFELRYPRGKGWLALGLAAPNGWMDGSKAIIGMDTSTNPGYASVGQYNISGYSKTNILPFTPPNAAQELADALFEQRSNLMTLRFTTSSIGGENIVVPFLPAPPTPFPTPSNTPPKVDLPAGEVSWADWSNALSKDNVTGAQVVLINLANASALAADLQKQGHIVICSFMAGTIGPSEKSAEWNAVKLGRFDGKEWVNLAQAKQVQRLVGDRIDQAKALGCDGIDPHDLNCLENPRCAAALKLKLQERKMTGRRLGGIFDGIVKDAQLAFNRWVANHAAAKGLVSALRNAPSIAHELAHDFDFAISQDCVQKNQCGQYKEFVDKGKPLLNTEFDSSSCPDTLMTMATKVCARNASTSGTCEESSKNCFDPASLVTEDVSPPTAAPTEKPTLPWPLSYFEDKELTLLIIVGSLIVFILFLMVVLLCFRCRSRAKKEVIKEQEEEIEKLKNASLYSRIFGTGGGSSRKAKHNQEKSNSSCCCFCCCSNGAKDEEPDAGGHITPASNFAQFLRKSNIERDV